MPTTISTPIYRLALPLAVGLSLLLAPLQLGAAELDREVAEWVIWVGGTVGVDGQPGRVNDVTALPEGDFELALIDLVGCNILPPDLQRLR